MLGCQEHLSACSIQPQVCNGSHLVDEVVKGVGHLAFQDDLQLLVHLLMNEGLDVLLVLCLRPHAWLQWQGSIGFP